MIFTWDIRGLSGEDFLARKSTSNFEVDFLAEMVEFLASDVDFLNSDVITM